MFSRFVINVQYFESLLRSQHAKIVWVDELVSSFNIWNQGRRQRVGDFVGRKRERKEEQFPKWGNISRVNAVRHLLLAVELCLAAMWHCTACLSTNLSLCYI